MQWGSDGVKIRDTMYRLLRIQFIDKKPPQAEGTGEDPGYEADGGPMDED